MKKITKLGMAAAVLFCVVELGSHTQAAMAAEETTIENGISIGNVNVGGMTENQAISAVEEYVDGLMDTTFTLKGETGSIQMTAEDMGVTADADTAVQEALAVGHAGSLINRYKTLQDLKKKKLVLDMHLSVNKQATAEKIYESADDLAVGAVDNGLKRVNGKFEFVKGKEGVEVDVVNSVYAINDFLAQGWDGSNNEIDLVTKTVEPRGDEKELAEIMDLIGSYTTNFASSSAGRAKNVITGVSKVDGTILYPGEEFDLAKTVSPFTQENGYELAGAYQNGTVVESFGGGICQVSTTLYNAVLFSELKVVKRYPHSMLLSYVPPSRDAAIAGDTKDFVFENNYDTPIYIFGEIDDNNQLCFAIYGKETRDKTRKIEFESEEVSTEEPGVKYKADAELALGEMEVTGSAHTGKEVKLWKIVYENGKQVSKDVINESTYSKADKTISVGIKTKNSSAAAVVKEAVSTQDKAKIQAAISEASSMESSSEQ